MRLIFTSNNPWLVPAEAGDQRYTVLDVGERKISCSSGGCAASWRTADQALMPHLLTILIDKGFIRLPLDTAARTEQITHTLGALTSGVVGATRAVFETPARPVSTSRPLADRVGSSWA
jgi:hypothetical protein